MNDPIFWVIFDHHFSFAYQQIESAVLIVLVLSIENISVGAHARATLEAPNGLAIFTAAKLQNGAGPEAASLVDEEVIRI